MHWRRQWHPTPELLPGKSHGQRSLVGCSPWGREESDTTERLHFHFPLSCIGEGNGNPLSVLAWRIPGMAEPGGLPSMGSHRVGHYWSDLVVVYAYLYIHIYALCLNTFHMYWNTSVCSICIEYSRTMYKLVTVVAFIVEAWKSSVSSKYNFPSCVLYIKSKFLNGCLYYLFSEK